MSFRIPYRGAGICFLKENNGKIYIFMGKRSRFPFFASWSIPGGSIEKSMKEDALTAAVRELKEETGITLTDRDIAVGSWTKRMPFFQWTTFFYLTDRDFKDAVPHEFFKLEWVDFSNLRKYYRRPFTLQEMNCGKELTISCHTAP